MLSVSRRLADRVRAASCEHRERHQIRCSRGHRRNLDRQGHTHAERAVEGSWCLPHLTDEPCLELEEARHPVVEDALRKDGERFVANDCSLGVNDRLWLITGPNMRDRGPA